MMRAASKSAVSRRAVLCTMRASRPMSTFYTEDHEYIKVDGETATMGITDFAQNQLGDVVYVELPEVDAEFNRGDVVGTVESVKAASDVYTPVSGTVTEVNDELVDNPALVNESPMDRAWFVRVKLSDAGELGDMMDEEAYKAHCAEAEN